MCCPTLAAWWLNQDVLFWCLSCHTGRTHKVPAPYYGFYRGSLPAQGGEPALQGYLQLNGRFETASSAALAAAPIAVIHFILGGSNEVVTPVPLLSHYSEHYFPNGGYVYIEVPFDITMHKSVHDYTCAQDARITQLKSHLAHSGRVLAFFSDHSEEDSGWLFAGREKGKFVTMSVSQVLSTILGPYCSVLGGAIMMFLVCGSVVAHGDTFSELQEALLNYGVASSIIFSAKHFQPLVATHFLLSLAEQVIIEDLDIRTAFPGLLSLSSHLGQHTDIILMTRDDAGGMHKLIITSWSERVAVKVSYEPLDPDAPAEAPVSRYLYSCTYPECGKAQRKPCYKFHIDKPPGFVVNAAKTKTTGWFQSPSTIFLVELSTQGKRQRSMNGEGLIMAEWQDARRGIVRTVRDYIIAKNKSQDELVELPKALKKEREAAAHPKDAAFYKKAVTDWDVAQKLFKQEIDEYDKEEQAKLGVKNEIKYRTGHARDWFKNMTLAQWKEVENAREKWNRDSAPLESQMMYRKRHLKRILDYFAEQMCRTMGCQVMILASHKKSADQTLNVIVHESKPVNSKKPFTQSSQGNKEWISEGFEKFAEWSKLEFYPDENDDQSTDDEEDDGKIFRASYKVFTNTNKPVPWHEVVAKPSLYLDLNSIPEGFILRDPSHMRAENINELWAHWQARKEENKKLVIFIAGKIGDMSKELLRDAVPHQEKTKKMYVKIEPVSSSESESGGTPSTSRRANLVKGANESAAAASMGRAQEGAPATVRMKDRIPFLKSLSSDNEYLLLVEGIRDLGKEPNFNQQKEWPAWATLSWEESYLPNDVHCVDGEVQKFLETAASIKISGLPSAMRVTLGLGLLLRKCNYISASILDIKVLDLVVESVNKVRGRLMHLLKSKDVQQESSILDNTAGGGGLGAEDDVHDHEDSVKGVVEAEMRQKLADELQMLQENTARNEKLKEENRMLEAAMKELQNTSRLLENQEEEDERRLAEEQRVEEVEQDEEGKEGEDVEVEVEVKGKKKSQVQWFSKAIQEGQG
ncbi:uncharacterized protein EDB93DRAFT_1109393 [Suillus bovinus]|uniref:uncharacterized protein n=1 Tax=Suillus bovinus TaxID=48563 RepID=UPI001B8611E9|nr:uncharacterized protein EDB93DRAFT_1109393 [Suillus bovinus]KAG2127185.1 hypothetical protein EDB93DRAFT_1109393 [Suillus bovinus]